MKNLSQMKHIFSWDLTKSCSAFLVKLSYCKQVSFLQYMECHTLTFLWFFCWLYVVDQLAKMSPEAHRNLTLCFPLGAVVRYSLIQFYSNFIEYKHHKWWELTLYIMYLNVCAHVRINRNIYIFSSLHSFCFFQVVFSAILHAFIIFLILLGFLLMIKVKN